MPKVKIKCHQTLELETNEAAS